MTEWRCPACLSRIEPARRLARCERGCVPEPNEAVTRSGSSSERLIFAPREFAEAHPRFGWLTGGKLPERVACPGCGKGTSRWVCPECERDLPRKPAELTSLAIVGPRGVGKTSLLGALVRGIELHEGVTHGLLIDPLDESTRSRMENPPTSVRMTRSCLDDAAILAPFQFRLTNQQGADLATRYLTLFDSAGDDWQQRREGFGRAARFLAQVDLLLYVLDPRRLEPVAAELRRRAMNTGRRMPPDDHYGGRRHPLADEIRFLGSLVELAGGPLPFAGRLAFVLTRLEDWGEIAAQGTLLHALGSGVPQAFPWENKLGELLHQEIEAQLAHWCGEMHLQQLALKFPDHRYFTTSSPENQGHVFGIAELARWVVQD